MAYKDPQKQKAADRERQRRYRAKQKGVTDVTPEPEGVTLANGNEIAGISVDDISDAALALPPDDELFAGLPGPLRSYADNMGGRGYKRLVHHLKTTPLEQLQTEGRPFIPCWRYVMEPKGVQ